MPTEIHTTNYRCTICYAVYQTLGEAELCETRPVSHDKGVKVGDVVRITQGQGAGHLCKVTSVFTLSRDWGHYAWERYWHTVAVSGDVLGSYGSCVLTFDSYEVIK